ncbi:MAG: hypothetical protein LBB81_00250 [Treponema sp.]|jgi:hypothetical protein|nr:hypothetical protein [Treponema sp.]
MSVFCLLWVPAFYLLRKTSAGQSGSGGIWALLLGSITAVIQFLLGYFISPGGFGFSRWLFGFIDIVCLPVLVPLIIYALLVFVRGVSNNFDFANFALLWLIPVAAIRAISWSSTSDPVLLVIVPLLWTALGTGIPFFIHLMLERPRWYVFLASVPCLLILPVAAALSYWALFSQQFPQGIGLCVLVNIPSLVPLAAGLIRNNIRV